VVAPPASILKSSNRMTFLPNKAPSTGMNNPETIRHRSRASVPRRFAFGKLIRSQKFNETLLFVKVEVLFYALTLLKMQ
jgi:hypothetical protein